MTPANGNTHTTPPPSPPGGSRDDTLGLVGYIEERLARMEDRFDRRFDELEDMLTHPKDGLGPRVSIGEGRDRRLLAMVGVLIFLHVADVIGWERALAAVKLLKGVL